MYIRELSDKFVDVMMRKGHVKVFCTVEDTID